MRTAIGWNEAKDISKYYAECRAKRIPFRDWSQKLTHVECDMGCYGDWNLYRDDQGRYWESYFSIGD